MPAPPPPLDTLERLGDAFARSRPVARRRMLVVANPCATTMSDRVKALVVEALRARYDVEAVETRARGHATELCREAAREGVDVVVSFGGDGTVNEAANGLAGSGVPLTCLPGGATNVLCKMLGIPADIVDATQHLLRAADHWRPRSIDLAHVNGRHFTFSSGLGLDAAVVKRVEEHPGGKTRLRQWYFAYSGVRTVATDYLAGAPRLELRVNGQRLRGVSAIVQNGDPYTYFDSRPLHLAEGATLTSGTLSGIVLRRATPLAVPTVIFRLFSGFSALQHRQIRSFRDASALSVRSVDGRAIPLQVDGDYIGDVTEARYGVRRHGLCVLA